MRPVQFHADSLVPLLRRERIATIEQLKATLGTSVDMTVFRKLREIPHHTSYSHRGRYYALDDVAHFDKRGLWTYRDVHFSRFGSLVETSERVVNDAEQGLFASELAQMVQADVGGPLGGVGGLPGRSLCCGWCESDAWGGRGANAVGEGPEGEG